MGVGKGGGKAAVLCKRSREGATVRGRRGLATVNMNLIY